jgi:YesN/AraC family two-component response regulator
MSKQEKPKVLFVDDEANVLKAIRRAVQDEEYESLFVQSGQEALEVLEKEKVAVLVTDMRMPGMDGLQLLKLAKEKYPATVRMVLSGYTQLSQVLATVNHAEVFSFITKPWDNEFSFSIKRALEFYHLKKMEADMKGTLESRNKAYKKVLDHMEGKIKDQEFRLGRIFSLSIQMEKARLSGAEDVVLNAAAQWMQTYSAGAASTEFLLQEEANQIKEWLVQYVEDENRVLENYETFGSVIGLRFMPFLLVKTILGKNLALLQGQVLLRKQEEKLLLEVLLITVKPDEKQRQLEDFFKEHLLESDVWFEEAEMADRRILKIGKPFLLR